MFFVNRLNYKNSSNRFHNLYHDKQTKETSLLFLFSYLILYIQVEEMLNERKTLSSFMLMLTN